MLEPQAEQNLFLPKPAEESRPKPAPLLETKVYPLHAYHLTEALKLKEVAKLFDLKPAVLNPTRLVYELGENGYCLLYNFGSVVFFNIDEAVQKTTLERLKNFLSSNIEELTSDEFLLEVEKRAKNNVFFEKVVVDKLNRDRIELIALVLAQSTALEYFEKKVDDLVETIRQKYPMKKLRKFINQTMATKQNLITTLYLLEKPDETWENKVLDDLHQEAVMMFELKDRFRAVEYKLKTIQENLELLANFASTRQMLVLEMAIVGLFVLDIILVGYELFWK